ncbi:MAG: hypothetical protein HDR37_08030 [Treponema sp.]|nr:hypothetical protein [Treponema sp.]
MDWKRIIDKIEEDTGKSVYKEIGCRSQFISDLRSGKSKNPGADFVFKLVKKFNLNIDYLITGEGEMFSAVQSPGDTVRVPLLSQRISCGPGQRWNSENNIIEYISIDTLAPRFEGRKIYGMRAKGTSMIGVGIEDGDVVLFSTNSDLPQTDGNYVFGLDGDVFCKRLEFDELSRKIKVYSVRKKGLEYAELVQTLCIDDSDFSERFVIFGKVFAWIHQV